MDESIAGIDWLTLVITVVFGFFLEKLVRAVDNYLTTAASVYIGNYYGYHFSTTGTGQVAQYNWKFYRKFNGAIGVSMHEKKPHENDFSYKGELKVKERHIYMHLRGKKNIEEVFYIIPEPVNRRIDQVFALSTALTMNKEPWAGVELVCSEEISLQKAKNILKEEQSIVIHESSNK
jgi:hypothetical protein